MDGKTIFGGNPLAVILRLVVLSIVVGIVLSALGINPRNFFYHLNVLLRRVYDLGFGAVEWIVEYFVLGAMVVVPIWIVARLLGLVGHRREEPRS